MKGTIYFLTTNVLDWKAEILFLVIHYSVSKGRKNGRMETVYEYNILWIKI